FATVSKVHDGSLIHVLAAANRDKLEPYTWWFPVVGKVPYKGFFDKKEAREAATSLEEDGYDTYVRSALAFSTLGWFDDPLPSVLLEREAVTLAQVVFHELFHRTLFVSGEMSFNESAANFAGDRAAIEFFCAEGSTRTAECREATADWKDTLTVSRFFDAALAGLAEFYETEPDEAELERGRVREFAAIRERFKSLDLRGRYANFLSGTLNNASLLETRMYYRDLDLFDELYRVRGSIRESIRALKEGLDEAGGDDPFDGLREALKAGKLEVAQAESAFSGSPR
ncbi:MAG: aminopeptidase, partial [Candidatus Binatia bacterium]